MDKYIVVTTLCNKEKITNKIIDTLLEKRLVAGSQLSKVHSKYWWNNKLEECDEFKIEFRTTLSLFEEVKNEIKKTHNYETPEISCYTISNGNSDFLNWIDKYTSK